MALMDYSKNDTTPLLPTQTTFRGKPLPAWLAFSKYWIDEARNAGREFNRVRKALRRFNRELTPKREELHDMQVLNCRTLGISNEFFHKYLTWNQSLHQFPTHSGLLADTENDVNRAVQAIKQDGYYVFPKKIPLPLVQALKDHALKTKVFPHSCDNVNLITVDEAKEKKESPVYWYQERDLVTSPEIQNLFSDYSILSIAQKYLSARPILDLVAMWWSFPFSKDPVPEAAQMYHFDMDRLKWLKFFVYLTDVSTDTAPHCFIKGTHKPFSQPWELLKYHYHRHPDSVVQKHFKKTDFIEFLGTQGTVIAEDTRGLHKGKHAVTGSRLIFELEFCGSLFGAHFERPEVHINRGSQLDLVQSKFPEIYSRLVIKR